MEFGNPRSKPPTDWENGIAGIEHVPGSDDIYIRVPDEVKVGDKGTDVWVWHWHMPTHGTHRWALASCGLHQVLSLNPLTLDPSLACEDGCPSHGWIRNGRWTNA